MTYTFAQADKDTASAREMIAYLTERIAATLAKAEQDAKMSSDPHWVYSAAKDSVREMEEMRDYLVRQSSHVYGCIEPNAIITTSGDIAFIGRDGLEIIKATL